MMFNIVLTNVIETFTNMRKREKKTTCQLISIHKFTKPIKKEEIVSLYVLLPKMQINEIFPIL